MEIKKGDILIANLKGIPIGSEQGGQRPVVVIQNNTGNRFSPTLIVASVTSKLNKTNIPTHVEIEDYEACGLEVPSVILLEQVRTIDKRRIKKKINKTENKELIEKIDKALRISFDL